MKHLKREIKYWIQDTARYYQLHHWRIMDFISRTAVCLGCGVMVGVCFGLLFGAYIGYGVFVLTAAWLMMRLPQ